MQQGNVAMWYDATSAAGSLEADDSPVKGKIGYVAAPVNKTQASGWLYTWAWAIQKASKKQDERVEVHLLGLEQGLREARGPAAGLGEGARRASGPRPTPTLTT